MDEVDLKSKLRELKRHRKNAYELLWRLEHEDKLNQIDKDLFDMFIKRLELDIWNLEFLIEFEENLLGVKL